MRDNRYEKDGDWDIKDTLSELGEEGKEAGQGAKEAIKKDFDQTKSDAQSFLDRDDRDPENRD